MNYSKNVNFSNMDLSFFDFADGTDTSVLFTLAEDNTWYNSLSSSPNAIVPAWDTDRLTSDPKITLDGAIVTVAANSPLVGRGDDDTHDIYGVPRANLTSGPVEAAS